MLLFHTANDRCLLTFAVSANVPIYTNLKVILYIIKTEELKVGRY